MDPDLLFKAATGVKPSEMSDLVRRIVTPVSDFPTFEQLLGVTVQPVTVKQWLGYDPAEITQRLMLLAGLTTEDLPNLQTEAERLTPEKVEQARLDFEALDGSRLTYEEARRWALQILVFIVYNPSIAAQWTEFGIWLLGQVN
jgi:hypothetical protein